MTRFAPLFSSDSNVTDALRQTQREAVIDALHYCMYADGRLVLAEDKIISDWSAKLAWESPVSVADYALESAAKALKAFEEPESRASFAADIGARLGDEAAKGLALRLCKKLVAADGFATDSEIRVLAELKLDNHIV